MQETYIFGDFFHSLIEEIAPFHATENLANGDAELLEEGGELENALQFPKAPEFPPLRLLRYQVSKMGFLKVWSGSYGVNF